VRGRAATVAVWLALGALGAAAGCGNGPVGPSTAPLSEGTEVSSQRYLADVDATAASLREFSALLEGVPTPATPASLRAIAPDLAATYARTRAIVGRLRNQRLADARLERQRALAVPALDEVLTAMDRVFTPASRGQVAQTAAAVEEFRRALEALSAVGGTPG
jgi:hypothetical protein